MFGSDTGALRTGEVFISRDLAIPCDALDCAALLEEWRWLVPEALTPLQIGIFGDWVFGAPDGTIWHLDLLEGRLGQIARTSREYNFLKVQPQYRNEWFGADWAEIALGNGLVPGPEECLGWTAPPIIGGPFSVENIMVFSQRIYQSLTGQLFRQLPRG